MNNVNDFIVVTSRIRLARNLKNYNFPHRLSDDKAYEVLNLVFNACDNIGTFNNYKVTNLKEDVLVEMLQDRLVSQKLINNIKSGVCISNDNSVSVMVNEEDVLREQCTIKGLSLKKAYDIINDIDNELSVYLEFAYDDKLGFLTACPTNIGTGLRASVMLFLPGLSLTKNIEQVINTVSKMGISVRGAYGEGTSASGYLYQVSNQQTLGKTEQEIIQSVESTVLKICELEKKAREQLLELNEIELKDDILRAYGILTSCYKITSSESIELLSKVKLGVSLNIITLKDDNVIDELLNTVNAVKINKISEKKLSAVERDIFRAQYLNRILKNAKII